MEKYIDETINMLKSSFKKGDDEKPAVPQVSGRDGENASRKEKKKVTKRKTFVKPAFYVKLIKGFIYFIQGAIVTIKTKEIQEAYASMIKVILLSILATYAITYCITYPLKFILHMLSYIGLNFPSVMEMLEPYNLLWQVAMFLPLALIGILRYVLPTFNDDMFFYVLNGQDSELCNFLKKSKVLKVYPMWNYVSRGLRLVGMGLFIYFTSFIPYVSNLVFAAAQFYYAREPLGMGISFILSFVSLLDRYRDTSTYILKLCMASHSLGKELLETYFARVPSVDNEYYLYRRFFGTIFGFSICWLVLLNKIPVVGVSLWPIAQGSGSYLLLRLLERNQWKSENGDSNFVLFGQHSTNSYCKKYNKYN
ncbi:hypothetical protein DLAC_06926 [Tieghemostelium lacteum]|uniref:Transmembrane protein n=1 Tax=Tieghemostelium lacteum TaxID=361077 RepID=A0A151ZDU3_TIELA|nr:hypothetical protein DLAC_06926 [Tieghemostelium lacteum]|eukprot:KYQ92089.1 hypothetical protein DLAC_06926 [Tieghemostelium lacteum]